MTSTPHDSESPVPEVIQRFEQEFLRAPDPAVVLERFRAQYPEMAETFVEIAEAVELLHAGPFKAPPANGAPGTDRPPARFGPYRVVRSIGWGGMGEVYEAVEEPLGRRVAVKTVRRGQGTGTSLMLRFDRERRTLARLHHTNIVPIFATGCEGDLLYFAMPYLSGASLGQVVKTARLHESLGQRLSGSSFEELLEEAHSRSQSVSADPVAAASPCSSTTKRGPEVHLLSKAYVRTAVHVMAVVAEGLQHAHEAGVIHRDLKPSNILVETGGHAWLLDFGLAALRITQDGGPPGPLASPIAPGAPETDASLTLGPLGTLPYMAPEQHRDGRQADVRSDVWGLGVTLYELLTLQRAFPTADAARSNEPTPPRRLNPAIDRDLEAVVLKAIRKEPSQRYASAHDLAVDLTRWLNTEPVAALPPRPPRRAWMWARRRPAAAAALIAIVAGVTGIWGVQTKLNRAETANLSARLEAETERAKAFQREVNATTLPRLRSAGHPAGWFDESWTRVRSLMTGNREDDLRFQGEAAAALEGIDAKLLKRFDRGASALAFEPGGRRLLMYSDFPGPDRRPVFRTRLWDGMDRESPPLDLGRGVIAFRGHTPLQLSLREGHPSTLTLYDAGSGEELRTFRFPLAGRSVVTAVALSKDGKRAGAIVRSVRQPDEKVSASPDTPSGPAGDTVTLVIWDTETGHLVRSWEQTGDRSLDLVLSPDGSVVATWDNDKAEHMVTVSRTLDGQVVGRFPTGHTDVTAVTFGRDPVLRMNSAGHPAPWLLAVGKHGGMITIWELTTGTVRSQCRGSVNQVMSLDFTDDGTYVISAGRAHGRVWDVATGALQLLLAFPSSVDYTHAVAFSSDSRRVALGSSPAWDSENVVVAELEYGRGLNRLRGLNQGVVRVLVSPDGRRVAGLSNDFEIGVWDIVSGQLLAAFDAPVGPFIDNTGLAFDGEGRRLLYSGGTEARLWDVDSRRLVDTWQMPPGLTEAPAFHGRDGLLVMRQETRSGKDYPVGHPQDDPRVCRLHELLPGGKRRLVREIPDFNWYVYHVYALDDSSYFVIEGTSERSGEKVRLTRLYQGPTGIPQSSLEFRHPADNTRTNAVGFDRTRKRLWALMGDEEAAQVGIFSLPGLTMVNVVPHVAPWTDGETVRWVHVDRETVNLFLITVHEQGRRDPLLRLARDTGVSPIETGVSRTGARILAWGNSDGTVTVCDLVEVQRRLAGIGLGW